MKTKAIYILVLLVFFFSDSSFSENRRLPEAELKKKADNFFAMQKFNEALPQYSQLLSVNPDNTKYIYRFGVCLLLVGKEKSNAATFLYLASKDPQTPADVYYYLGRGYLINYDFQKALECFDIFKSKESSKNLSNYDVEAYIQNCESGAKLLEKRKNVIITSSKEVPLYSFYQNYDFSQSFGKVVNASASLLSPKDIKEQSDHVMFVSNDRNYVYLSRFGKNSIQGKDIFIARKNASNDFSAPENLSSVINTVKDEDFPFLANNGSTLYFSSKGHNSIGGFDIFKSEYDNVTKTWSTPENMGIPINTTSDDFLYVPSSDGLTASYATTEESDNSKVIVRKIKVENSSNKMVTITGVYLPVDQKVRRDARITVLTSSGNGIITSTHTDSHTGSYKLIIPSGENYLVLVEGGGYIPHLENFNLPASLTSDDVKQVVQIDKQDQVEKMILQNFFSQGLEASIPSNTLSKSYPVKVDSSSLVKVNINDQIVYATPPALLNRNDFQDSQNSGSDSYNADSTGLSLLDKKRAALPNVKINRKDKYDPSLEKNLSSGNVLQKEEEANRRQELRIEDETPEIIFDSNISNEEIAKIAFLDAQEMQIEADSLYNLSHSLRDQAAAKLDLALYNKKLSETPGLDADSSAALIELSELNKSEGDQIAFDASNASELASAREKEAQLAFTDANEIASISKVSGPIASNTKTIIKPERTFKKTDSKVNEVAKSGQLEKNSNENKPKADQEIVAINSSKVQTPLVEETIAITKNTSSLSTKEQTGKSQENNTINATGPSKTEADSINKESIQNTGLSIKNDPGKVDSTGIAENKFNVNSNAPVNAEAQKSFREYQNRISTSNTLSAQSLQLQDQINASPNSSYRDSLIGKSNEISLASIKEWQEAQQKIKVARTLDPGIDYKMGITANTEQSPAIQDAKVSDKVTTKETANTSVFALNNPASSDTRAISSPTIASSENSKSNVETTEESAFNNKSNLSDVSSMPDAEEEIDLTNINTAHPEFPKYMKIKKDIRDVQKETIKIFAKAMDLNRKASEEKEKSLELMDQAQMESDERKKKELLRKWEGLQSSSEKHDKESKKMLVNTQDNLGDVRFLKHDMMVVRKKILIRPEDESTQAYNSANTQSTAANSQSEKPMEKTSVSSPLVSTSENKKPEQVALNTTASPNGPAVNETVNQNPSGMDNSVVKEKIVVPANTTDKGKTVVPAKTTDKSETVVPANTADKSETVVPAKTTDKSETVVPANTTDKSKTVVPANKTDKSETVVSANTTDKVKTVVPANTKDKGKTVIRASTIDKSEISVDANANENKDSKDSIEKEKSRGIENAPIKETPVVKEKVASKKESENIQANSNVKENRTGNANPVVKENSVSTNSNSVKEKDISKTISAPIEKIEVNGNVEKNSDASLKNEKTGVSNNLVQKGSAVNNQNTIGKENTAAKSGTALKENTTSKENVVKSIGAINKDNTDNKSNTVANENPVAEGKVVNEKLMASVKNASKKVSTPSVSETATDKRSLKKDKVVISESKENTESKAEKSVQPQKVQTVNSTEPVFAKANDISDPLAVTEEDIASANVSKRETDEFLNKVFSLNTISTDATGNQIPMDPQLPEGLVFKVQISAFQKPINSNSFNGLKPLTGESTRPGWIRYCVGLFKTFEPANMVKREIQKIGYKDAFVVAYLNGKRISLNEAYQMIKGKENLSVYKNQSAKEISMLQTANIFPDRNASKAEDKDEIAFYGKQAMPAAPEVSQTVEYSVQVGVYSNSKPQGIVSAISDLRIEQINDKLFRFSSGRYPDYASADLSRKKIIQDGIKDAFVIVYRNGNYEVVKDAALLSSNNKPAETNKSTSNTLDIKPVEKTSALIYKVQIGAYKRNLPFNKIESYLAFNARGITTQTDERGLHIFYVGSFDNFRNAEILRQEALKKGVTDAFVIALQNGKRVPISEEMKK